MRSPTPASSRERGFQAAAHVRSRERGTARRRHALRDAARGQPDGTVQAAVRAGAHGRVQGIRLVRYRARRSLCGALPGEGRRHRGSARGDCSNGAATRLGGVAFFAHRGRGIAPGSAKQSVCSRLRSFVGSRLRTNYGHVRRCGIDRVRRAGAGRGGPLRIGGRNHLPLQRTAAQAMKIAVLGGGHGCYAAAADLAEQGHEVRLWRRDRAAFEPVRATGAITLIDHRGARAVPIANATLDIGEALRGAELILVALPATAQEDIARSMAPHLTSGQVVFLPPGSFGSYVMAEIARQAGSRAALTHAETGTLPHLARKRGPAEVAITIRATRLPAGAYPAKRSVQAFEVIRRAYRSGEPRRAS